jgi:SET and MYND domain-containing protein 4
MFCTEKCHKKALQSFHNFECPVMCSLIKSGSVQISLRIFFISFSAFNESIENLENFMIENDKSDSSVFDFDFSHENREENVKNYLKCLSSLSRSTKMFSLDAHAEILRNHSKLSKVWLSHEKFIRNFIMKQCQTNDLYFHGIFGGNVKKNNSTEPVKIFKDLQQSIGSGWFPFCSLINHSCAPNVLRVYFDGKVALIVCRPIEKGSQLFDCYK